MNLRTRVAVSGAGAVVAALAAVGAIAYPALDAQMRHNIDAQLSSSTENAQMELKYALRDLKGGENEAQDQILIPIGTRILDILLRPSVGMPDKLLPVTDHDLAVGAGEAPPYFDDVRLNGDLNRAYVAPLSLSDFPGAVVRIIQPESDRIQALHQFGLLLATLIPAAGLVAALGARLLAARVLSPVARLTSAVEHVTVTGDLATPIAVTGRDEVARLGLAFNAMTSALDGSVGAQRRLVADASHELRTPLTSMTTNLELLAERPDDPQAPRLIDEALRQARELTLLTNDLVDLARYGEVPARDELVYVDQVCTELAERRGVEVELQTGPPPQAQALAQPHLYSQPQSQSYSLSQLETAPNLPAGGLLVRGDPAALERAVANLVDNALKFGTTARITVRSGSGSVSGSSGSGPVSGSGAVIVEVRDDGPGIPPGDLPYVFDRFHRAEAARALPGSGLGLAIVKHIVEAHRGRVEAVPQDRGALLRITLPAAAAP